MHLQVLARGRLTLYEARGDLQLVVEDLEPLGEGLARLELEGRKRRLAAEGLFDPARKRALPLMPRAIGVVTSASGAALQDILQVLSRRAPGVSIFVAPARVQGKEAPGELRDALALVSSHPGVDVIILGRGGGSAEDLSAFDDEALVRAVAACPVPVVSAVGHETDVTLVDFAADARAPTPSAAAEMAVKEWAHALDQIRRVETALGSALLRRISNLRVRLGRTDPMTRTPLPRVDRTRIRLDRAVEALDGYVRRAIVRRRSALNVLAEGVARLAPERRLGVFAERLEGLQTRLGSGMRRILDGRRLRLEALEAGLEALSPLAVLARGYAIARKDGRVIRDAAACSPGERISVVVARGGMECLVSAVVPGEAGECDAWIR
jgi:exodeoxyribonuclease VII large subunit